MKSYRYTAVNAVGTIIKGTAKSQDKFALADMLYSEGMTATEITPLSWTSAVWGFLQKEITPRQPIASQHLARYAANLSLLLSAGIPTLDAVRLVASENTGIGKSAARLAQAAKHLAQRVSDGASLGQASSEIEREVGRRFVAAVRGGEASGRLPMVLERLASEMRAVENAKKNAVSALLYPTILSASSVAAVSVLLLVVVPTIERLVDPARLNDMPYLTQMLIHVSRLCRENGPDVLAGMAVVACLTLASMTIAEGRKVWGRRLLRIRLWREWTMGRYLNDLGMLLASSVPLEQGMRLAADGIRNAALRSLIEDAARKVVSGSMLSEAMQGSGVVDFEITALLQVGERSGRLAERISDAGAILSRRASERVGTYLALAGPVMTLLFGVICGLTAAALLTTILSLNGLAT